MTSSPPRVPAALTLIRRAAAGESILNHDLEGAIAQSPRRISLLEYQLLAHLQRPITPSAPSLPPPSKLPTRSVPKPPSFRAKSLPPSAAWPAPSPTRSTTRSSPSPTSSTSPAPTPSSPKSRNYSTSPTRNFAASPSSPNQTLRFHKQASSPREISCKRPLLHRPQSL